MPGFRLLGRRVLINSPVLVRCAAGSWLNSGLVGLSPAAMAEPIGAWLTGGHAVGDRSTYGFGAVTCSPGSLSVLPSVTPSTAGICSTRDSPEEGWPDKR